MRLASALREESPDDLHATGQEAVEQIDDEIVKLRRLITELRPASLDTIGLEAALYALAQQHQEAGDLDRRATSSSPREDGERPAALLETAVYRLVQEALNNVSKHSMAQQAELKVRELEATSRSRSRRRRRLRAEPGAGRVRARRDARAGWRCSVNAAASIPHRDPEPDSGGDPAQPAGRGLIGSRPLDVDQAAVDRVADQLRAGRHRELLLDVGAMGLDGAHTQVELLGDLVVGVPERDQPQHLELALGEVVGGRGVGLGREARASSGCR